MPCARHAHGLPPECWCERNCDSDSVCVRVARAGEWNLDEEREALQRRVEDLAAMARDDHAPSKWPFARVVHEYLQSTSPAHFAESVRAMLEELVTACQEPPPPPPLEGSRGGGGGAAAEPRPPFSAEWPFSLALPFLRLSPGLAGDPSIRLDATNFALPVVQPDEPWPPAEESMLHPVYLHAQSQLRVIEHAAQASRSRSRAARADIPELPITLSAEPCVSMLLHPGRVVSHDAEPVVRIALISMTVRDAMPPEIPIDVYATPWTDGAGGGGGEGAAVLLLSFAVRRDEFAQQGPSGPIEAKRVVVLHLETVGVRRMRISFDVRRAAAQQAGLCDTPPLLLEHRPPVPAEGVREF